MEVLKYLQEMILTYSDYGISSLIRTLIITAAGLLLFIIFLSILVRKSDKNADFKYHSIIVAFLKGFRVFTAFLACYILLLAIKTPEKAEYPTNLFHRGIELAVLYSGLIAAILKIIKELKVRSIESFKETILPSALVKTSGRGVNIIVILLVISTFISQLKRDFSTELESELWISLVVLINSFLLLVALFFAVEKILPQIQNYLTAHFPAGIAGHFLSVISNPLKLFIIVIFLISLQPVVPETGKLSIIVGMLKEIFISAAIILLIFNFIEIFISRLSKQSELTTNSLDKTLIEMIRMILRVCFIASFIFLSIRIITGKPLTTLLAGLGIGGLAVALAAQDTLKNFFGSIMIMTDKPFKVGERISTEGYDGTIESIGFRSTRIRTLTGNQVVIPNDKVAQSSIENIGRRQSIRRLTNITITYSTPPEKVEKALSIIREILDNHEGMLPDLPPRVVFNEFNADSLNILMLYWYSPPDYWAYMEFTEKVNLKIMKMFAEEGIDFAFPTHTTYLEQEDGKSIKLDLNSFDK